MNLYAHMFLYSLDKQLEICSRYNLKCLLSLNTKIFGGIDLEDLKGLVDKHKISVAIHAPVQDMYLGSVDIYIRLATKRRLIESVRIAKMVDADFMVIHMNYYELMHRYYKNEWIQNAVETLEELLGYGVEIHIENSIETHYDIFLEVFRELEYKKNIGFCLDIGHIIAFSEDTVDEWVASLAGWIREIHLHETIRGKDLHKPMGYGSVEWDKIFSLLSSYGVKLREVPMVIEPISEEDLAKSINFLQEFFI